VFSTLLTTSTREGSVNTSRVKNHRLSLWRISNREIGKMSSITKREWGEDCVRSRRISKMTREVMAVTWRRRTLI
jgi:hypothetical protein